jgi:outer membrane protein OmpA-like peptidoglycan-associated protein
LVDYASSIFRLHQYARSFELYKSAHRKNMLNNPVNINEFIQLEKIFHAENVTTIAANHEKTLSTAGYKKIAVGKSNFKYAVPKTVCFNSNADDFGIFPIDNLLLFSSTRNKLDKNIENSLIKTFAVKNNSCEAVSISEENDNIILKQINKINTKYHLGPVCISKDKSKIFVTVSQKNKDKNGIYNLTILVSTLINNVYSDFIALPFENVNFTMQHPSYDNNSGYLFFSSNMTGGAGGFDIYKTKYDGIKWSTPENIVAINTASTEAFPFISTNGDLYYSGKTIDGFGGLDILKLEKGNSTPILLDQPINSAYDDFGIFISDNLQGYFCSNRITENTNDNIFTYQIQIPPYKFMIVVKDEQMKTYLKDATIKIKYKDSVTTVMSNDSGAISFMLPGDLEESTWNAELTFIKTGFVSLTATASEKLGEQRNFIIEKMIRKEELAPVIEVKQVAEKLKVGVDLGKLLNLNPIYFDVNKFDIRTDAANELDKIVKAMNELPNLIIELGSHTDSRGSTKSNQELSQKRAESSGKYIISKGIDAKKLSWKGYGESKPLNKCKDGVKCSEPEYSINRRTEFKIVKM